jgi:SEC-C motif
MSKENLETVSPSPSTIGRMLHSQSDIDGSVRREPAPGDARELVARMVDAGEHPEPELLEQILATGEDAVEPLLEVLRSKPQGWPAEARLYLATGLLQVLRPPAAIPELIEIIKSYSADAGEDAGNAIAVYGETVFEPLLELAADPASGEDTRNSAISAARKIASANPALRARLSELLRPMLADAIEQYKRKPEQDAAEPDSDEGDNEFDTDFDPDEESFDDDASPQSEDQVFHSGDSTQIKKKPERDLVGEILFRTADLAAMADPLARDMIKTAYKEGLVEAFFLSEEAVDNLYDQGGEPAWQPPDWLDNYRDAFQRHLEREEKASRVVKALVDQMVQAGEWPLPHLLQQIISLKDRAVEPLHDLLRARPRGWPKLDSLKHAIGLLSDLKRPETVPELVKIVEGYDDETCMKAANALIEFGSPGFDALINVCSNQALSGYQRAFALEAAVDAAGHDPARRSKLAETARPMLDRAIAEAREELKPKGFLDKHAPENFDDDVDDLDEFDESDDDVTAGSLTDFEQDPAIDSDEKVLTTNVDLEDDDWDDEEDDGEDDDVEIEPFTAETVALVVSALASIGDPLARDTITKAYDEGLVDESIVSRKHVDEHYKRAGEPAEEVPALSWLTLYRQDHAEHVKSLKPEVPEMAPRPKYLYQDRYEEGEPPPGVPAIAPIRNTRPKLGRNDPCWCGSGKKYKKCHLGKDQPA